jgi:cob(I)alamin adenosyltransferase
MAVKTRVNERVRNILVQEQTRLFERVEERLDQPKERFDQCTNRVTKVNEKRLNNLEESLDDLQENDKSLKNPSGLFEEILAGDLDL